MNILLGIQMTIALDINSVRSIEIFQKTIEFMVVARKNGGAPAAQDLYTIIPELDTGKGYADLALIPKKPNLPAILIELKYEENAETAISQIHRQKYPDRLALYKGNLILVGINFRK